MRNHPDPVHAATARLRTIRESLSALEWTRLTGMFAFIIALNVAGWLIFILYVMPHHFHYKGVGGSRGLGVGLGVAITAWFLGFRHAFDADHISCIDNTTRKLMADGKRPLGTGFFFSFGHSTVIVAVGVGTIEILGILTTEFHLNGAFWDAMANFNINIAGFCIAGLFVLVWAVAIAYWRFGKVEDRWSATVPAESPQVAGQLPDA